MKNTNIILCWPGDPPSKPPKLAMGIKNFWISPLETDLLKIPGCHRSGNGVHFV